MGEKAMKGVLADHNIVGHLRAMLIILEGEEWGLVWESLNLKVFTFQDFGLSTDLSDSALWKKCQQQEVVLLTGNRNKTGPDSLQATIEEFNTPTSLPILTIGTPEQVFRSGEYAERAAIRLLEFLIDMEYYRGSGRLWLP